MGEMYALAAAVLWAFAVILFRRSGETVPPFSLNLFRVAVSGALFGTLLIGLVQVGLYDWPDVPLSDYLLLFVSGAIGIALADTLFHRSLNRIGAGLTAIVDCLYSPFMVLFAFLLIGERLGGWQLLGMLLVIAGVLCTTRIEPPPGMRTREMLMGIGWGALAMATMALGIAIAKPVLDHTPVLWATAMRQYGSLLVMIPIVLLSPQRRQILAVFRPARSWRFTLSGTLLGSFLALLCWIAGMKYTQVGTAAILNQTTTIHLLILATIFLKEPFTRRKVVAALLALGGILLVIMG